MPRRNAVFLAGVNASSRYSEWPVFSCPLMAGFGCPPRLIYFDESAPSMRDVSTSPYFIVCAVHLESPRELRLLARRLDWIRELIGVPPEFEFKSSRLSRAKYETVLKELAPSEFRWACVCFVKSALRGQGFSRPAVFFRYAYQFLVGDLLSMTWNADLYFDEYSSKDSSFQREFKAYLREQNAGLPAGRLKDIDALESLEQPLIQLADLLAGVVKNRAKGTSDLLHLVDDKAISVRVWPPRADK